MNNTYYMHYSYQLDGFGFGADATTGMKEPMRHNIPPADTFNQIGIVVRHLDGKRLTYDDLRAPTGRASGALA